MPFDNAQWDDPPEPDKDEISFGELVLAMIALFCVFVALGLSFGFVIAWTSCSAYAVIFALCDRYLRISRAITMTIHFAGNFALIILSMCLAR